jgi:hypothetical protein
VLAVDEVLDLNHRQSPSGRDVKKLGQGLTGKYTERSLRFRANANDYKREGLMFASLRALLDGVIDYAGLFPPAKLPLDQSLRNYVKFRKEPEHWMLGRFICPVARLRELADLLEGVAPSGPPIEVAALGETRSVELFDAGIAKDIATLQKVNRSRSRLIASDAYEVKLPSGWWRPPRMRLTDWGALRSVHIETDLGADARSWLPELLEAGNQAGRRLGFKLRCGGLDATAFPKPEQVAFTIIACRDAGVPLKFTAGLHHPIRHIDAGLQTHMHGFINVFVAGVLAHVRRLSEEQVRAIIADENPHDFVFDDGGLHWNDYRATTEEIAAARRDVVSFGSCSFDEPRKDLRELGWLE